MNLEDIDEDFESAGDCSVCGAMLDMYEASFCSCCGQAFCRELHGSRYNGNHICENCKDIE